MATQPGSPPPDRDNPQTPAETPPLPDDPGPAGPPMEEPVESPDIDQPGIGPDEMPEV